jgi:hypothetical protein
MAAEQTSDYAAGAQAAREGKGGDECPFAFARVGVDQEQFDREYRMRLIAWTMGWRHESDRLKKARPPNYRNRYKRCFEPKELPHGR